MFPIMRLDSLRHLRALLTFLAFGASVGAVACAPPAEENAADDSAAVAAQGAAAITRTSGYRAMPDLQRKAVDRLLAGKVNLYSRAAKRDLAALAGAPAFESANAEEQAKQIWDTLHVQTNAAKPARDGLFVGAWPEYAQYIQASIPAGGKVEWDTPSVADHVGVAEPKNADAYIGKLGNLLSPTPAKGGLITEADFDLTPERTALFPIRVGGERVLIAAPLGADGEAPARDAGREFPGDKTSNGPLANHSVERVAQAVADLPAGTRRFLTGAVNITSARSPLDAPFAKLQGRDDMRAVMQATVFPSGSVGIFALPKNDLGDVQFDSLVHEVGHLWSFADFGLDPNSDGWLAWKEAIAGDAIAPSWYAGRNMLEDVAESFLLYSAIRSAGPNGKALAAEMAAIFQNRWKILERKVGSR